MSWDPGSPRGWGMCHNRRVASAGPFSRDGVPPSVHPVPGRRSAGGHHYVALCGGFSLQEGTRHLVLLSRAPPFSISAHATYVHVLCLHIIFGLAHDFGSAITLPGSPPLPLQKARPPRGEGMQTLWWLSLEIILRKSGFLSPREAGFNLQTVTLEPSIRWGMKTCRSKRGPASG